MKLKGSLLAAMVLVAGLSFSSATVFAKAVASKGTSFEEMLKTQQAEIDELKKEISELKVSGDKGGLSGYDHGFFIKSRDDLYSFKLRLFAQIFYQYQLNEDAPDTNSFGLQRARLLFSGNVFSKNLTYMVMTEMVSQYNVPISQTAYTVVDSGGDTSSFTVTDRTDRNFRLLYLWAQYKFADEFQIRIGEFIPPTEFFFRASNLLEFFNFPVIATTDPFTPNFQTGLDLLGTVAKKLDYEVFAVNGSNFDNLNFNKAFRIGSCLTYNFLGNPGLGVADVDYSEKPQLALTLSGAYEKWDYPVAAPANIQRGDTAIRGQTDLVFRYKGFSLVPEFIVFYDQTQHEKHYALAAQAGYFVIPKHLEFDVQANWLKWSGPRNDNYEISGGFNYYFYGHPVKLQADYSALLNKMPAGDQLNHRIRVGVQVGFF